ncbi:hypothetical protein SY88_11045 [Clostridiales bacterium PH28_bin88]|nr:hypothetical protein SY88_11045 [Clostridiales bacterium PH28_bin88]
MSDLDMLYDYEKDARLAALGYLGMAAEAHDEKLREKFAMLSTASQKTHELFTTMIIKKGGNIF